MKHTEEYEEYKKMNDRQLIFEALYHILWNTMQEQIDDIYDMDSDMCLVLEKRAAMRAADGRPRRKNRYSSIHAGGKHAHRQPPR